MSEPSSSASTDYFKDDDPAFIEALHKIDLPRGSQAAEQPPPVPCSQTSPLRIVDGSEDEEMQMPPSAQPCLKRRIMSDEEVLASVAEGKDTTYLSNDTYGPSNFGKFGQYMSRKRAKLQIQNAELEGGEGSSSKGIFHGLQIYVRLSKGQSQHALIQCPRNRSMAGRSLPFRICVNSSYNTEASFTPILTGKV